MTAPWLGRNNFFSVWVTILSLLSSMPCPHFCNFCKNHGVSTRVTHAHRASCPWKDCVCLNCTRTRHRNSYHRNLRNVETSTVTSTTTTPVAAVVGTLGTVSAANVLAVANSGQKASATSVAAARAGKLN